MSIFENSPARRPRLLVLTGVASNDNGVGAANNLVKLWRTWQYAQSLSSRTVHERTTTVIRMGRWCLVEPEHATVEQIASWLAEGGNWAPRTRWTYHSALCAWFLWLQKQGHRVDNPMVMIGKPRRPRSVPRPISNRDLTRLLSIRMHRRTRAMILLAAFAGLRVHEIAKVRGDHLDTIERQFVVTGKAAVTATLPLHHMVIEQAYQMPREGWWFPGADHGHQRRESIGGTIKEAMIRAGVAGSAHQLRHWFLSELVETGTDLRTVQELGRHASLSSTAIYTLVTDQRRVEGVDRLNPWRAVTPTPRAVNAVKWTALVADGVASVTGPDVA